MYKVFIKDKQIQFNSNQHCVDNVKEGLFFSFFSVEMIPDILSVLESNTKLFLVQFSIDDVNESFLQFCSFFTTIEAAGGVVKNNKNQILFIFRNGKWDLPKGKIELGEKIEQAAIREVEEECAATELTIIKPMNNCYHIYRLNSQIILKKTYWFEMKTSSNKLLQPQEEEGIEKVEWMDNEQINRIVLSNTYASIADIIRTQF
ncbi:MAG: NUDIX domain-containing protein [Flavobacteriales bacterium]|nr:NUDIX domain-containing protein [Flavobacteriales bacterium]